MPSTLSASRPDDLAERIDQLVTLTGTGQSQAHEGYLANQALLEDAARRASSELGRHALATMREAGRQDYAAHLATVAAVRLADRGDHADADAMNKEADARREIAAGMRSNPNPEPPAPEPPGGWEWPRGYEPKGTIMSDNSDVVFDDRAATDGQRGTLPDGDPKYDEQTAENMRTLEKIEREGGPEALIEAFKDGYTNWGHAQEASEIAPGIYHIVTGGHGGYYLSPERYEQMPEQLRQCSFTKDRFFDEDSSYIAVELTFPAETESSRKDALERYNADYRDELGPLDMSTLPPERGREIDTPTPNATTQAADPWTAARDGDHASGQAAQQGQLLTAPPEGGNSPKGPDMQGTNPNIVFEEARDSVQPGGKDYSTLQQQPAPAASIEEEPQRQASQVAAAELGHDADGPNVGGADRPEPTKTRAITLGQAPGIGLTIDEVNLDRRDTGVDRALVREAELAEAGRVAEALAADQAQGQQAPEPDAVRIDQEPPSVAGLDNEPTVQEVRQAEAEQRDAEASTKRQAAELPGAENREVASEVATDWAAQARAALSSIKAEKAALEEGNEQGNSQDGGRGYTAAFRSFGNGL